MILNQNVLHVVYNNHCTNSDGFDDTIRMHIWKWHNLVPRPYENEKIICKNESDKMKKLFFQDT